jgi:hypothetical protein
VAIDDMLEAAAEARSRHRAAWTFAFAPGVAVSEQSSGGWVVETPAKRRYSLELPVDFRGDPLDIVAECTTASTSPRYGVRVPSAVLRWRWEGTLPITVRIELRAHER